MRYVEFRDSIRGELARHPAGLTWAELQSRLDLPYDRPCPNWTKCLEREIGLKRLKGEERALIWKVPAKRRRP
jgi:hypothetical protein